MYYFMLRIVVLSQVYFPFPILYCWQVFLYVADSLFQTVSYVCYLMAVYISTADFVGMFVLSVQPKNNKFVFVVKIKGYKMLQRIV